METFQWESSLIAVEKLLSDCVCRLCDNILQKPAVVGRCYHVFCYKCVLKLCQDSKDTVCPECNEPFWIKDIRIDHQVENIITLCNNFLLKLENWKSEIKCNTEHNSKTTEPHYHNVENETEVKLRSPTKTLRYVDKLENSIQIHDCSIEDHVKVHCNTSLLAYNASLALDHDDIPSTNISPVQVSSETGQILNNMPSNNKISIGYEPSNEIAVDMKSQRTSLTGNNKESQAPLYHSPPQKEDSYITTGIPSGFESQDRKQSQVGLEIISGKTIDLCQSSFPCIDLTTTPNSTNNILKMFDESCDEESEECVASKNEYLSDSVNIKSGIKAKKLKTNKNDVFCNIGLPDTPKESCTQKSVHVKPVGRTYTRRCKYKMLSNETFKNDSLVESWLDSAVMTHDDFNNSVSTELNKLPEESHNLTTPSIKRYRLRSSDDNRHTPILSTKRKSKRSISSSSVQSTGSSVLKISNLNAKVRKSQIEATPGKRKSTYESDPKTPTEKKALYQKTPRSMPCNKRNQRGETPLHVAAIAGNTEKVRTLLEEGADPSEEDNAGWTPLHETCINKHVACAKLLVEFGAPVNARAHNHDTPLHDACAKNVTEIVKLLLDSGACKSAKNISGLTPLDFAASDEIIQLLNDAKDPENLDLLDKSTANTETKSVPVLLFSGLTTQEIVRYRKFPLDHEIVNNFSGNVTHLVCGVDKQGFCKRTIKFLQAMAVGITLVKVSWLEKSKLKKCWEPTSTHLVKGALGFTPGSPKQSYSDALAGVPRLFTGLTFYVDRNLKCTPSRDIIVQLIQSCNGIIINREPKSREPTCSTKVYHGKSDSYFQACPIVIISNEKRNLSEILVHPHSWVLDCISSYEILE